MIYESVAISIVPRFPIAIAREDNIARPLSRLYSEFFEYCELHRWDLALLYIHVHISSIERKKQFSFSF